MSTSDSNACPLPSPLTPQQTASKTAAMLDAMNCGTCSNSSTSVHSDAEVKAFMGILGSANVNLDINNSSSYGCEQIMVSSAKYATAISKISCIIKKNATSINNVATGVNTIDIRAGGDINIAGPIKLTQSATILLVNTTKITQTVKNEITNEVKSVTDNLKNSIQFSKTETGSNPQGSKAANEVESLYNSSDFNKSVDETINNFDNTANGTNILSIYAGGNINLKDKLEVSQDLVVTLLSQNILDNAITNTFKNISDILNKNVDTTKQTSENTGFASIYSSLYGYANIMKIVLGVIALLILIILMYYYYKKHIEKK